MSGYQGNRKLRTSELLSLNINTFKVGRYDNATITSSWNNGSSVNIVKVGDHLILDYVATINGTKQSYNYPIDIDYTRCNYGGERKWFICPHCFKRVGKLYLKGGIFKCRSCQKLNYSLQQENKNDYSIRRIDHKIYKLQDKLKIERDILNVYCIQRPKGMHHKTFDKLINELQVLDQQREKEVSRIATMMGYVI